MDDRVRTLAKVPGQTAVALWLVAGNEQKAVYAAKNLFVIVRGFDLAGRVSSSRGKTRVTGARK